MINVLRNTFISHFHIFKYVLIFYLFQNCVFRTTTLFIERGIQKENQNLPESDMRSLYLLNCPFKHLILQYIQKYACVLEANVKPQNNMFFVLEFNVYTYIHTFRKAIKAYQLKRTQNTAGNSELHIFSKRRKLIQLIQLDRFSIYTA